MRIAIIGQAAFGAAVYQRLRDDGHTIVGVFTPPRGSAPTPSRRPPAATALPSTSPAAGSARASPKSPPSTPTPPPTPP